MFIAVYHVRLFFLIPEGNAPHLLAISSNRFRGCVFLLFLFLFRWLNERHEHFCEETGNSQTFDEARRRRHTTTTSSWQPYYPVDDRAFSWWRSIIPSQGHQCASNGQVAAMADTRCLQTFGIWMRLCDADNVVKDVV